MSDAVDVDQDREFAEDLDDDVDAGAEGMAPATGLGILPQTLLEPAEPAPEAVHAEPAPAAATVPAGSERPDKQGLLVRLGHLLCGFRG